jgi:hypothetical protein
VDIHTGIMQDGKAKIVYLEPDTPPRHPNATGKSMVEHDMAFLNECGRISPDAGRQYASTLP